MSDPALEVSQSLLSGEYTSKCRIYSYLEVECCWHYVSHHNVASVTLFIVPLKRTCILTVWRTRLYDRLFITLRTVRAYDPRKMYDTHRNGRYTKSISVWKYSIVYNHCKVRMLRIHAIGRFLQPSSSYDRRKYRTTLSASSKVWERSYLQAFGQHG